MKIYAVHAKTFADQRTLDKLVGKDVWALGYDAYTNTNNYYRLVEKFPSRKGDMPTNYVCNTLASVYFFPGQQSVNEIKISEGIRTWIQLSDLKIYVPLELYTTAEIYNIMEDKAGDESLV